MERKTDPLDIDGFEGTRIVRHQELHDRLTGISTPESLGDPSWGDLEGASNLLRRRWVPPAILGLAGLACAVTAVATGSMLLAALVYLFGFLALAWNVLGDE